MIYNLLSFPAGVVPVSRVTVEDEEELRNFKGIFDDQWDKLFKEVRNRLMSNDVIQLLCETFNLFSWIYDVSFKYIIRVKF